MGNKNSSEVSEVDRKGKKKGVVNKVNKIGKETTTHGGEHEFSGAGSMKQDQISAQRHAEEPPERGKGIAGYPTLSIIPGSIQPNEDKVAMGKPHEKQSYEHYDAQKDLLCAATKQDENPSMEFRHKKIVEQLNKELHELRNQEAAFKVQIEEYKKEIHRLNEIQNKKRSGQTQNQDEIIRLQKENEKLQLRLSRIASDHLTDNNPDIADLSDKNRATNLSEQFGEIYCNEWTAAFDSLTERFKKTDRESIALLLKILQTINTVCKSRARDQLRTLQTNVANFIGTDALPYNVTVTLKALKDAKKNGYTCTLTGIEEEIKSDLTKEIGLAVLEDHNVMKYVLSVTKVCWLMNISDPPLVIYAKCKPGAILDRNYFKEYVSAGDTVDFLVWPALLLCKDGSILRKGIAEPKKDINQDGQ